MAEEKKTKKKMKKWLKVTLIVVCSIVGTLFVAWGGWNIIKFGVYSEYYGISQKVRTNPGLNDGYVTQGITYLPDSDTFLTSGYMTSKGSPSRVYAVDKDNNVVHSEVYIDEDNACTAHFGGMTVMGNYAYLASNSKAYVVKLDDVLNGKKAVVVSTVDFKSAASFIYSDDDYVYVGEFNDGDTYKTEHYNVVTGGDKYSAIVCVYNRASVVIGVPVLVREYAIRDQVQGFCVTDKYAVISTSWGINDSHYYAYNLPATSDVDALDGLTPVYYLDSRYLVKDVKGPAMAEDLDYKNGLVYNASEAASNKYIFGKFFFYDKIVSLKFE